MRLLWTSRARRDLVDIARYIAADNPRAARTRVERLRERARKAAAAPRTSRVVPELGRSDIREVLLRTYRIVYRVQREAIVVLTVFEGHKRLDADQLEQKGRCPRRLFRSSRRFGTSVGTLLAT